MSIILPLLFHPVHGIGVKVLNKQQGVAKTEENISSHRSHGHGFVFSDRAIKVGEHVCLQILQLSNYSNVRLGFTSTNPDSFPKSLLGFGNKATIQVAECWMQEEPHLEFKSNSKISYSVNKLGQVHLEINGIDKGTITTEVNTRGLLWAVINLCGHDAQIQAIGVKQILPPVQVKKPLPTVEIVRDALNKTSSWDNATDQKPKKTIHKKTPNRPKQASTANRFDSLDLLENETSELPDSTADSTKQSLGLKQRGKSRPSQKPTTQKMNKKSEQFDKENSNTVIYLVLVVGALCIFAMLNLFKE